VDTFVLFGAVHHYGVRKPAIFASGQWETPLGRIDIDQSLAETILSSTKLISEDTQSHALEHSLEVQVPFIQRLFPQAKIVPIMVPPESPAGEVGRTVGKAILDSNASAVCIGSSDLTHYGPNYGFTPEGSDETGIRWARDVNDKGLIERIAAMDAEGMLEYALTNQAACGSGAIAATILAAQTLGADTVTLLEHTNSYEVLRQKYGEMDSNAVGYAAILFGMDK
jgi:AmmeMemoRadiSam system protein B